MSQTHWQVVAGGVVEQLSTAVKPSIVIVRRFRSLHATVFVHIQSGVPRHRVAAKTFTENHIIVT